MKKLILIAGILGLACCFTGCRDVQPQEMIVPETPVVCEVTGEKDKEYVGTGKAEYAASEEEQYVAVGIQECAGSEEEDKEYVGTGKPEYVVAEEKGQEYVETGKPEYVASEEEKQEYSAADIIPEDFDYGTATEEKMQGPVMVSQSPEATPQPTHNHTYVTTGVYYTRPVCEGNGLEIYECSECHETMMFLAEALTHAWVTAVYGGENCRSQIYTVCYCSRCETEKSIELGGYGDHVWKDATRTEIMPDEEGNPVTLTIREERCSVCDAVRQETED